MKKTIFILLFVFVFVLAGCAPAPVQQQGPPPGFELFPQAPGENETPLPPAHDDAENKEDVENLPPAVEPDPEPQPEPDPEPQPEPDPEPQPEPDPEPQPEPDPEPQPEPDPEPQPEPDPEPQPEPDPEPQPEPDPEPQPEPDPEPQPEPEPEPQPDPEPQPEPDPEPQPEPDPEPQPEPGHDHDHDENVHHAPDFVVYDLAGNAVRLSDYIGKPIVLNFWASWCGPCKMEMPDFDEVYRQYGDEVQFLMVNLTDGSYETVATAAAFVAQNGYAFPVLFDTSGQAANTYQIYSIPTTYFIDAGGHLIARAEGAIDAASLQYGISLIR